MTASRSFDLAIIKLILRSKHFAQASGGAYQKKARPCFVTRLGRQGFWAAPLCGAGQILSGEYGPRERVRMQLNSIAVY